MADSRYFQIFQILYFTHPLLSIGILKVVDALGVPFLTDTEQTARPESVLRHDDEVHEEATASLDHTDLTVGHTDQTVNQNNQHAHFKILIHEIRMASGKCKWQVQVAS